ncbi:hypothetical protein [Planomonospora sphaerica]|uniref:hypothetical protein n=1 Tax=Planomonospora sphaerica TaxID=161355 RepID=UPI00083B80DE|nr:hypothetical protein [Planomonospora sphaerica]
MKCASGKTGKRVFSWYYIRIDRHAPALGGRAEEGSFRAPYGDAHRTAAKGGSGTGAAIGHEDEEDFEGDEDFEDGSGGDSGGAADESDDSGGSGSDDADGGVTGCGFNCTSRCTGICTGNDSRSRARTRSGRR